MASIVSITIMNKIMARDKKIRYSIIQEEAKEYQCIRDKINAYKWHFERVNQCIEHAIICKAISKKIIVLKRLSEDPMYKFHSTAGYLLECYNYGHIQNMDNDIFYGIEVIMFCIYGIFPTDINNHISMYINFPYYEYDSDHDIYDYQKN